jgi:hypothetical protein
VETPIHYYLRRRLVTELKLAKAVVMSSWLAIAISFVLWRLFHSSDF